MPNFSQAPPLSTRSNISGLRDFWSQIALGAEKNIRNMMGVRLFHHKSQRRAFSIIKAIGTPDILAKSLVAVPLNSTDLTESIVVLETPYKNGFRQDKEWAG